MIYPYEKCPKCNANAVQIATAAVFDDFWAGFDIDRNENESEYMDQPPPEMDTDVTLLAHICYKCGHLLDIEISTNANTTLHLAEPKQEDSAP